MSFRIQKILLFFFVATANLGCLAQKKTDSIIVKSKAWQKDDKKQVYYSDWKEYTATRVSTLAGFKPGKKQETDKYGGLFSIKRDGTGFFTTEQIENRWWVMDPFGHPTIISAVNSIRLGKSAKNDEAFVNKFGSVQSWITATIDSLRSFGFNTAGCWSDTSAIIEYNRTAATPFSYTTQLNLLSGYANMAKKESKERKQQSVLSFILDDEFPTYCDEQAQKLKSISNDPNLLGHFSDNELPFTHTEFDEMLNVEDKSNKCYVAVIDWMKEKGIDEKKITRENKEEFLGWLAAKYYETVCKAIKKYDANHLFIGGRLHSSAKNNKNIFKAAEPFVDIFSINYYGEWEPQADHIANWASWTSKPFFITEFYTKAEETGMSNLSGAGWIVKTQAERGIHYQNFCIKLLQAKNCVGWHWFRYQDNDPSDATADASNKDSNKGIVDTEYKSYRELAESMKQLNDNKYSLISYFDSKK